MIRRLVIFGASGDLTARYLLPAVAQLHDAGRLQEDFVIVGVARDDWDVGTFRAHIERVSADHWGDTSETARKRTLSQLVYRRADVTEEDEVRSAITPEDPEVIYLALPQGVVAPTLEALRRLQLHDESRIVLEKPFGEDVSSARKLNELIHEIFREEVVFRIDHFLHKQTVQNVLGLRFANRIFEPVWSSHHVERVEVVWDETLALEGRASYYDHAGALKDMLQNHLLQLVSLIGMEVPASLNERDLRDKKVDLLRSVRRLSPEEVKERTVRARYAAGRVRDRDVVAYRDEPGVDPTRETETYAEAALFVDNWRWAGVPFFLRSGKALSTDRTEVTVRFKSVPHLPFSEESVPELNVIRLQLGPDRLSLGLNINGEGDPFDLEHTELDAELAPQEIAAYGRLLIDVFEGDPTLSIRDDEAEESWRIVEPILDGWEAGLVPLREYAAGSTGPTTAGSRSSR